ncbi:MAG: hypothetical protein IKD69_11370 [Solobacterium sp.]|nr:hypothetical protein [Solobacterium sp.]
MSQSQTNVEEVLKEIRLITEKAAGTKDKAVAKSLMEQAEQSWQAVENPSEADIVSACEYFAAAYDKLNEYDKAIQKSMQELEIVERLKVRSPESLHDYSEFSA